MTSTDITNEETLIEQAKTGDLNAFDCIYRRYLPLVYRRVHFVIPESDVEDVTQEIFIAMIKSLWSFRGEARFSTWLRILTNRKVAEYYRKRDSDHIALDDVKPCQHAMPMTPHTLEDRIALRHALNQISERHRDIILLRFAEGLQFSQIAEVLGISLEATKSLFRRAIQALREHLE